MDVSHRPNRAVCVASAITTLSGWCGSRYQTETGAGLTFFGLLFGKSGIGKSDCGTTYETLETALTLDGDDGIFANRFLEAHTITGRSTGGAAIRRRLGDIYQDNNETVSVSMFCEEVGHVISGAMRAGSNSKDFIDLIYDMFTTAGRNKSLVSKLYVGDENTVPKLRSANMSFLGEGTKESVFENLSIADLDKGLFPRFCYVDCGETKPRGNKNQKHAEDCPPNLRSNCIKFMKIIQRMEELAEYHMIKAKPDAQEWLDKFEDAVDDYTDQLENIDPARVMYNRHHLITLRLSCLAAISKNYINPIIDMECIKWAQAFTTNSIHTVLSAMEEEKDDAYSKREISLATILVKHLDIDTIGSAKSDKRSKRLIEAGIVRWSDFTINVKKWPGFRETESVKYRNAPQLAREVLSEFEALGILEPAELIEVRAILPTASGGKYYKMNSKGYEMLRERAKYA